MTDPTAAPATGTLQLKTSFFVLMWILFFLKPKMRVNGHEVPLAGWGESQHQLYAGPNNIEVWFPYLVPKEAGLAKATVDVPANGVVRLEYRPPWLIFLAGKLTQTAPV